MTRSSPSGGSSPHGPSPQGPSTGGPDSHYFDEQPQAASKPVDVTILLPDLSFTLTTDTGVFARGALDAGTRLLLAEQWPLPASGNLLDLGCGAGAIAITMAFRAPKATVWAVDVNARAVELTRTNATRAGAHNVRAGLPADVEASVQFQAIWSNPPIRIGKAALHELLSTWITRLAGPDAEAMLVVSKHLGSDSLAAWLRAQGWDVARVRAKTGYRVLRVRQSVQT